LMEEGGDLSVVVPTHDRPDQVAFLLESLRRYGPEEMKAVVVVDDSESPADLGRFADIGLQHIVLPKRMFISRAKNLGWRNTKTEFVLFVDDDNVMGPNTIETLLNRIRASPAIGALMPSVLYKSDPGLVWVYATPFDQGQRRHTLLGRNDRRNKNLEDRLLPTDALPNAALVRRKALEQIRGFDEGLVVNSSMDFCQRLKAAGWRVYADSGSLIYHDVEVPSKFGWWAQHGPTDPERVRYEVRDWFMMRKRLEGGKRFFILRSLPESARFLLPNALAYATKGRKGRAALINLARGFAEGLGLSLR
jgi:GT2 family glycosyltransferase